MPVLLDVGEEQQVEGIKDYSNGVPLVMTSKIQGEVVMTRYISTNPAKADWQPSGEWREQVVADVGRGNVARITVPGLDGEPRAVAIDDGLIIDLVGVMTKVVGIIPGQAPMNETEVEDYIAATDQPVPTFQQWDFTVANVAKTDGPAARLNLAKSEEQKRAQSSATMYEAIAKAFQEGMGQQSGELAPSAQKALSAGLKGKTEKA